MSNHRTTIVGPMALGACLALAACNARTSRTADSASTVAMAPAANDTSRHDAASHGEVTGAAANVPLSDANVVSLLAFSNDAEVEQGRAAEGRAGNAEVKAFARKMVQDHGAMLEQGDSLARTQGLSPQAPPLESTLRAEARATADSLERLGGAAFDKAYMAAQVRAHQETLTNLQKWQGSTQDSALRTLISGAIPKVQQHLEMAQKLQAKVGS